MGWGGWKPPVEFHVSIFYTCYTMYSIFQITKYQKVQLQEQRKDILNVSLRVLSLPFQNIIRIHRTSFAFSGHSLTMSNNPALALANYILWGINALAQRDKHVL